MVRNSREIRWSLGMIGLALTLLAALAGGAQAQQTSPPAAPAAGDPTADFGPDYILGPGDVIDVAVWKDETLTKSLVILPDGKISFPLIGEIKAAGRTLQQVKQEITKKISPYAPDPIISIEVRQVNSMLIYVIGRVNTPGRFALNTNINVLQALTMAGGLNAFAKRNKIKIFRQEGNKTTIFRFKYDDVTEGTELEQNIVLKRGDIIVVP